MYCLREYNNRAKERLTVKLGVKDYLTPVAGKTAGR